MQLHGQAVKKYTSFLDFFILYSLELYTLNMNIRKVRAFLPNDTAQFSKILERTKTGFKAFCEWRKSQLPVNASKSRKGHNGPRTACQKYVFVTFNNYLLLFDLAFRSMYPSCSPWTVDTLRCNLIKLKGATNFTFKVYSILVYAWRDLDFK